jgi:hypothetical protein
VTTCEPWSRTIVVARRSTIRSVLSPTYAEVAPRCSQGPAAGAVSARARTWAITSWRVSVSSSSARASSAGVISMWAASCSSASDGMSIPRSRSARISSSHSRRQVENLVAGENSSRIALEA